MPIYFKQIGFTLIELLIVIALFGVLAAFAVPSYLNMLENSRIKTATNSIITGLQIARAEAVKRNTRVQFDFRTDSAWTVCLAPAVAGTACPAGTNIESRSANDGSSANVEIAESGAGGPYVFNGFGGMVSPATAITINITNSSLGGSRDLRVVVGVGGAVKSCDPALASGGTDPRRC